MLMALHIRQLGLLIMTTTDTTRDASEALAVALGREPSTPGDPYLAKDVVADAFWSFEPNLEIVLATAEGRPGAAALRRAWSQRVNRRAIPLILIVQTPDGTVAVGPAGDPPPIASVSVGAVAHDLRACTEMDPLDVRVRLAAALERADASAGISGVINRNLFSTHFLEARVPLLPAWQDLQEIGRAGAAARTTQARLTALGFEHEETKNNVFLLRTGGSPAAAIFLLPAGHDLDRSTSGGQLPVANLLQQMQNANVKWGILAAGDVWRLYRSDAQSPTDSYAEIEIGKLSSPAYFALFFSAVALDSDGVAEQVLRGSAEFAVALGRRLRSRVYEHVVPVLVKGFAGAAERSGRSLETREDRETVYDATLTVLYRLLFLFYAEARRYLPVDSNEAYQVHSLRKIVDLALKTSESGEFSRDSTDIWTDLCQVFDAVSQGHSEWGVPAYNGRLFSADDERPHVQLLNDVSIANAELGPALIKLAYDDSEDAAGRVDYSDLDIRRLGDIYEGLLQFEVDRAGTPLVLDTKDDIYRPALEGEEHAVESGEIFVRSRGGGRKASGSFYTPQFIVRHVAKESLAPALQDHLDDVLALAKTDQEAAARRLFDFAICDPAMGSGHFLVDALTVTTERIAIWLAENPLPPVRTMLDALREAAADQARSLGPSNLADVQDVDLLKRLVLKRCIYGVDKNGMAVDLARLALWLEAFVPGLPLSYLDHNLQHGNSLVGVVGNEVVDAISGAHGGNVSLAAGQILATMEESMAHARDLVDQVEYGKSDIESAAQAQHDLADSLSGISAIYDVWTSEPFVGPATRDLISALESPSSASDVQVLRDQVGGAALEDAKSASRSHEFLHWPLAFPEIFGRARPGFDVVLANPPWEKIKPEKHNYYALFAPGLKGVRDAKERDKIMDGLDASGSGAAAVFEAAQIEYEATKCYFSVAGGNYELGGSGDIDLFKAFAERFLRLARTGGRIGVVLPDQFLGGTGAKLLRKGYLANEQISIDVLWNRKSWVFENVDSTYTVCVVSLKLAQHGDGIVHTAGPVDQPERFLKLREIRHKFPVSLLLRWSSNCEIPFFPDPQGAAIFEKLMSQPSFGEDLADSWKAIPYRELDATNDRPGLFHDMPGDQDWEVWKGESFDLWSIDQHVEYWVSQDQVRNRLIEKRKNATGTWTQFDVDDRSESATLPIDGARIAFRDATKPINSRTVIAALIPPHTALIHQAPTLLWPRGTVLDQAYLLGVLCSSPFDWCARRRVVRHMTFGILNSLPVPRIATNHGIGMRIARNAAKLACVDERFEDFAKRAGIEIHALGAEEREALIAENDALTALSYELNRDELKFMFDDFNERGLPSARRELILEYFDRESNG